MPAGDDRITGALSQQGAPDGRLPGDVAGGAIRLVDADDPVGGGLAVLVLDRDRGAEEDPIAVRLRRGIDDQDVIEALGEEAESAVDLAQLALVLSNTWPSAARMPRMRTSVVYGSGTCSITSHIVTTSKEPAG